jgi:hypothetical protein
MNKCGWRCSTVAELGFQSLALIGRGRREGKRQREREREIISSNLLMIFYYYSTTA